MRGDDLNRRVVVDRFFILNERFGWYRYEKLERLERDNESLSNLILGNSNLTTEFLEPSMLLKINNSYNEISNSNLKCVF